MLNLSCHCGAIHLALLKKPDFMHECNCSACSKSGARWGYFHPTDVSVEGACISYCRADKADPGAQFHFCGICGSTTHFTLTDSAIAQHGDSMLGVNMRLAADNELGGIELRYPDGKNWAGEGEFGYVREARVVGGDG